MTIQTIIFDFGNVVAFFSYRRAAENMAVYSPLGTDAILEWTFQSDLERLYESGQISTEDLFERVKQGLHLSCNFEQFSHAFCDMFTPNPDVARLIPRLVGKVPLLLLSNTNDLHARWFLKEYADTVAHFDDLILSYKVGARKPDGRIYQECVARAGCPAGQCLFIDDMQVNVDGALACGLQAILYGPGDDLAGNLAALGVPLAAA
jgi:putative hydrolase of the HAD superfamily